MTILAVETATSLQSVAVVGENGFCAAETMTQTRATIRTRDHFQPWSIMPAIDRLLNALNITLRDIDGFAVSIGPGSFTGLRVGVATVQGLAHGTGKPLVAVPTLQALAINGVGLGAPICTLLDARRGELFLALFHEHNHPELQPALSEILQPRRIPVDQALGYLNPYAHKNVIFVGDGVTLCRSMLAEKFGARALFAPQIARYPSAISVAHIGKIRVAHGMLDNEHIVPIYLRPPDAKPNVLHRGVEPGTLLDPRRDHRPAT